ncbi:(5-formylfuran-3-yl)methyl phosphate synthase [archaeon]|nr:(5-formylfuran-3-yl)methyl phosphate synthase [archaeon]
MKLLVSPTSIEEAKVAIEGGAGIIDVKNPKEGSLGANFPWTVEAVKAIIPQGVELSATIGDLQYKPGTASLAAFGLAKLGVDYVKAGLFGIRNKEEALDMAQNLKRATDGAKLVLAGYADYESIGAISPLVLPKIASQAGAFGVMIDTAGKNGNTLFSHMGEKELKTFIDAAHSHGLIAALAGSLSFDDVLKLKDMGADIAGVRGAVCTNGDRMKGSISKEKVQKLMSLL